MGDRWREGKAYANLGNIFVSLGDFKTAIEYNGRALKIAKEVGDNVSLASLSYDLGTSFESVGSIREALDHYTTSVATYNDIRDHLKFNDEWKISLRDTYPMGYNRLWRLLLNQGKVVKALFFAEQGLAQALKDLMELKYAFEANHAGLGTVDEIVNDILSCLPSNTVFKAVFKQELIFGVCQKGKDVELRR